MLCERSPRNRQTQMMKCIVTAISLLQNHNPRFTFTKARLRCRPLSSISTLQDSYQLHEMDPEIGSIHSISLNPCFSILGFCRSVCSLKMMHAFLVIHRESDDLLLQTKLVSLYGLFGHIEDACSVFDQIRDPDIFPCKVMIRWYFLNNLWREIIGFYVYMRKCLRESDNMVFSIVLKACSELREIDGGRKVHCHIITAGNPDSFVLTGLVDMYAKCGDVESSRLVFVAIADKNVVCWTSMIVGYVQNDFLEEGLILFTHMRDELVQGNQYTLGIIVTACTKLRALHQGRWVHGYIIKNGTEFNPHLVTSLVDLYVKCGAIRDARHIFDESCSIDLVSWTAMIVGYAQSGYLDEALMLFADKKWERIFPNSVTLSSVLSACAQSQNLKMGKSVHCLGIKLGLEDVSVRNALVDMYAKCQMIQDSHYLFVTAPVTNLITWNSIISGYDQNSLPYEAIRLFHQMRLKSLLPDEVTLVTMLSVSASLSSVQFGSSLHAYAVKRALLTYNVYVGTALLYFYAKCGDATSARSVFDGMTEKSTTTWSAMIGSYGMQGDSSGSLAVFDDMMERKIQPSDVTFMAILSACSHSGMVEEGWRYFDSMCQEYNFLPSMRHYGCMVDLLARAGRLEEALNFIDKVPVKPDVSLFGAFLHGCTLHSRFDLGEVAVERMLEQHPNDASYYVLVSKLYALDARWYKAHQVMELMKMQGLKKSAGCSHVDADTADDFVLPRLASLS